MPDKGYEKRKDGPRVPELGRNYLFGVDESALTTKIDGGNVRYALYKNSKKVGSSESTFEEFWKMIRPSVKVNDKLSLFPRSTLIFPFPKTKEEYAVKSIDQKKQEITFVVTKKNGDTREVTLTGAAFDALLTERDKEREDWNKKQNERKEREAQFLHVMYERDGKKRECRVSEYQENLDVGLFINYYDTDKKGVVQEFMPYEDLAVENPNIQKEIEAELAKGENGKVKKGKRPRNIGRSSNTSGKKNIPDTISTIDTADENKDAKNALSLEEQFWIARGEADRFQEEGNAAYERDDIDGISALQERIFEKTSALEKIPGKEYLVNELYEVRGDLQLKKEELIDLAEGKQNKREDVEGLGNDLHIGDRFDNAGKIFVLKEIENYDDKDALRFVFKEENGATVIRISLAQYEKHKNSMKRIISEDKNVAPFVSGDYRNTALPAEKGDWGNVSDSVKKERSLKVSVYEQKKEEVEELGSTLVKLEQKERSITDELAALEEALLQIQEKKQKIFQKMQDQKKHFEELYKESGVKVADPVLIDGKYEIHCDLARGRYLSYTYFYSPDTGDQLSFAYEDRHNEKLQTIDENWEMYPESANVKEKVQWIGAHTLYTYPTDIDNPDEKYVENFEEDRKRRRGKFEYITHLTDQEVENILRDACGIMTIKIEEYGGLAAAVTHVAKEYGFRIRASYEEKTGKKEEDSEKEKIMTALKGAKSMTDKKLRNILMTEIHMEDHEITGLGGPQKALASIAKEYGFKVKDLG